MQNRYISSSCKNIVSQVITTQYYWDFWRATGTDTPSKCSPLKNISRNDYNAEKGNNRKTAQLPLEGKQGSF